MYKVNYTFKEDEYTHMGSFEVSNCSFNENKFFSLVDYQGETSLSVLHLHEAPDVYGKTIYLNVKKIDLPKAGLMEYRVFARLNSFRYED